MNKNHCYPENTAIAIKVEKLIRIDENRLSSEKMSSRMVKCASLLEPGTYLGWQMLIPVKGLVDFSLFGTSEFCRTDLEWLVERTAKISKKNCAVMLDPSLQELYEIYLPIAEEESFTSTMGFGNGDKTCASKVFAKWPNYCFTQFADLIRILQNTGAALRITMGPATEDEVFICHKNTLRTYNISNINFDDYFGRPVKLRALLLLPAFPSVRLRTILEGTVQGIKLRHLGNVDNPDVIAIWDNPLNAATVLPDYAARILTMEPELDTTVIGMEICEAEMKKIPASHKNTRHKNAVTIGRAIDMTGIKRKITIGETDLKRHYQIVGQTGTGKSTLLSTLILSAIEGGYGMTFFDPHGSTIDSLLRSIPEKHLDRIRVVRIGDAKNPVPLNIWDSDDPAKEERNISDLCELFGDVFNTSDGILVGPRYERWLSTFAKASIAFLGRKASLESIAVISQSQDNMLKVSKAIVSRYPELVETIKQEYIMDRSSDFQNTLNWYLCKFQRLTSVEQLRKTLGAGTNALDFVSTIDTDKVTLIDLGLPVIGTHAARIIGTLLLMKLWNAALVRKERERTHFVIIDEASLFQTNPMPRMLAESRKFGISMVLCHQHTGQLSAEIRDALEANSANFSAFRLSPRDAAIAAVRFDDPLMQISLTRLDAFNAITTLSVDGRQTAPFTLETECPKKQKYGEEIAEIIEAESIAKLVKPYSNLRALTSVEILKLLNNSRRELRQNIS